jgi:RNA polymerase-binding transcription factor DksA
MTTRIRTQHLTRHDAGERLEHERNSRLAQLRAIEESSPHADQDLQDTQTAAIERVLEEIEAAEQRLTDGSYGTCGHCQAAAIPIERLEILPLPALPRRMQQRLS